ncbi:MAG: hypothetical protein ACLVE5_13885 [Clostridium perfringens]
MDIKDQLELVNERLKDGLSITKIEKELKLGKDTLRKRLNKQGYRYNKELKQFEFNSEYQQTNKQINKTTKSETNKLTNKQIITDKEEQKNLNELTLDEIKFLKDWIKKKKLLNQEVDKQILSNQFKPTTLEIEVNLYKKLEEYCYKNKETKKSVINKALSNYLE